MVSARTRMVKVVIEERFFNSCFIHEEEGRKNEEKSFCMDCCLPLCFHCLPHHYSHSLLQIRRYMYNDVLRLKDAHKIFDCSLIQSFTTNSEKVVLLRPKQRVSYPIRGSRCKCLVCNHNIKSSFAYCSMACKFSVVTASTSGGERVNYAYNSKDPAAAPRVSGGAHNYAKDESQLVVTEEESSVEENSRIATAAGDDDHHELTNIYHEGLVNFVHQKKQVRRKLHGRKSCVPPQRSPLF